MEEILCNENILNEKINGIEGTSETGEFSSKKKYVSWENTLEDKINLNKQVVWSVSVLWMGGN